MDTAKGLSTKNTLSRAFNSPAARTGMTIAVAATAAAFAGPVAAAGIAAAAGTMADRQKKSKPTL